MESFTVLQYQKNSLGDYHPTHVRFVFEQSECGLTRVTCSEGGTSTYLRTIPRPVAEKFFGGEYEPTDEEIYGFNEEYKLIV